METFDYGTQKLKERPVIAVLGMCRNCIFFKENTCLRYNMITAKDRYCKSFLENKENKGEK